MLITCWSAKGGVGTTVATALLGLARAPDTPAGVTLVDLCGDLAAALGVTPEPASGLADWLERPEVPLDALARLAVEVRPGLHLIGPGRGSDPPTPVAPARLELLCSQLDSGGVVIVDAGTLPLRPGAAGGVGHHFASASTQSLLVTRRCYLSLRRAAALPLRPSGVILVDEPFRHLGPADVAEVVGAPVVLQIDLDPAIANAVDAGVLATRLPRKLASAIARVA
jgi:MinD-like ATPase involved in chromosome partitioning or flagellar assembly